MPRQGQGRPVTILSQEQVRLGDSRDQPPRASSIMDLKVFFVVFGTVFLAELGDKTQLATVLFASRPEASLATVFVGASLALILSSLLAVAAGSVISQYVDPRYLSYIAGAGFIVIGIWTIVQAA